ncbi:hypothetical protein PMAYCL1PPCAC_02852 [Pristionchus mayeri]|uniref:NADAR domain-containing protein n=1 Tax=Pristionchus mayeri TaxID=1317129 RepID=A0AAN5C7C3_9BILA|nr:hypothetical protein PMAYCL1PPCAC_02852 [Pristionchus mayeri]
MSTPATWRDIERSQKRREKNDRFRSSQLTQSRYSSRDQFREPAPRMPVQQPNNWRNQPTWSQGNTGYMDFSSDSFAISNQMPFQQNYMMPNGPQYVQQPMMSQQSMMVQQPVMSVQQQEFIDYTVSPTNIILFHGKHYMSTLYKSPMRIEEFEYPSVEHYYQACKLYTLGGSDLALRMNKVSDPSQCKSAVRNILNSVNIPKQKIESWRRTEAPEILVHANLYKFAQNRELREKLLSTGDALLVHTFDKDDLYAVGMNEEATKKWSLDNNGKHIQVPRYFLTDWFVHADKLPTYNGKGRNILGIILMMIREVFRPENNRADPKIMSLLHNMTGPRF